MTSAGIWLAAASAFLASVVLTYAVRHLALARGAVDLPNARSSHATPTPRGGGVAIVLVTSAWIAILWRRGLLQGDLASAAGVGGVIVAVVGLIDDHRSLPSGVRLIAHFVAAVWAVAWLGGLPALRVGANLVDLGWMGDAIAVLGIVWVLNLFNFMDGIDGIAASEAMFVVLAGAALTGNAAGSGGFSAVAVLLGASCAGFLLWNWPPAKIFLGDVGSGYLGYMIAALCLAATRTNSAAVWVWLILGAAFFADATTTLARRLTRGESPAAAHRSHAYQWLSRRYQSHFKVTGALWVLNLLVFLPIALLAARRPEVAGVAVLGTLALVALGCLIAGAGRPEEVADRRP